MNFYAVNSGYKIGIYDNWEDCSKNIKGYKNPIFKKFSNFDEAKYFVKYGKCIEKKSITYNSDVENKLSNYLNSIDLLDPLLPDIDNKINSYSIESDSNNYIIFNKEHLKLGKSKNGTWHRTQLELLGFNYPPPINWKNMILGKELDEKIIKKFIDLKTEPITESDYDIHIYTCINIENESIMAGIYFKEYDIYNTGFCFNNKYDIKTGNLILLTRLVTILKENSLINKKILIYTDSKYSIKCCTKFGEQNEKINWTKKIHNLELVKNVYDLYKNYKNINFHLLDKGNSHQHNDSINKTLIISRLDSKK